MSVDEDFSAGARPVVWPCLSVQDGRLTVELTSNSPLPWRIRAAPGAALDPQGTVDHSSGLVKLYTITPATTSTSARSTNRLMIESSICTEVVNGPGN